MDNGAQEQHALHKISTYKHNHYNI